VQFGVVGIPLNRSVIDAMLHPPSTYGGSRALTSSLLNNGGCSLVHNVT
jgi:hypothetical protein